MSQNAMDSPLMPEHRSFFCSKMANVSVTYFDTLRQMASEKEALIKNNLFSLLMIYYNTNVYLCL